MIDYKLAKQLKENGFDGTIYNGGNDVYSEHKCKKGSKDCVKGCGTIFTPNLSELIDALGKNYFSLTRTRNKWSCHYKKDNSFEWYKSISFKSPDEAVAKVWLKANKTKVNVSSFVKDKLKLNE